MHQAYTRCKLEIHCKQCRAAAVQVHVLLYTKAVCCKCFPFEYSAADPCIGCKQGQPQWLLGTQQ
jgi:hypothetical protein